MTCHAIRLLESSTAPKGENEAMNLSFQDYKLYKVAWNAVTYNAETLQRTDLRIGEVIYEFVSYNVPSFWLISLNGFDLIFLLRRDSENDL